MFFLNFQGFWKLSEGFGWLKKWGATEGVVVLMVV